jgi:coenzyme F420-reducing hydrogenase gamma subunit
MKPRIAVHKFTSCDGCQLTFLNCEEEFLAVAGAVEIAHFAEAGSDLRPGPYDVSFVEGSVSTPEEVRKIQGIREDSRLVVAIGACATSGGIQALRNGMVLDTVKAAVYPTPEVVAALPHSTPISAHIVVDLELQGCPISKAQLLSVIASLVAGRIPVLPGHSVCLDCKQKGNVCVVVRGGTPCMGPVTRTGCGALCPSYDRGCYGCFGPSDDPQLDAFGAMLTGLGLTADGIRMEYRKFNAQAAGFRPGAE